MYESKTAFDNRTWFCPKLYTRCRLGHLWNTILMTWQIKKATAIKRGNSEKQVLAICEAELVEKQQIVEKTHVETSHTATTPLYHISIIPLTPINHTCNISIQTDTLLESLPLYQTTKHHNHANTTENRR